MTAKKTEAKATPAPAAKAEPKTVAMVRDEQTNPEPHTADVHADEVENYAAAGWEKA